MTSHRETGRGLRVSVLCRTGAQSSLLTPWLDAVPAPVDVVEDFDEDWNPSDEVALVVTHCHYEVRDLILLERLRCEGRVGVLVLADGILEYRNTWEHPELPPGALFQPVRGHKLACVGRSQARVVEGWGNVGRCEVVGLPRLDPWIGARPRARARDDAFRILVATANNPGFTEAQRDAVLRSLRDLRDWHARRESVDGSRVELVWRVGGGMDDALGIAPALRSPRSQPLPEALTGVDALVTTPSTTQVEAMLQGLPVALLDYTNSPHYVPGAWRVTSESHLDDVLPQLRHPPAAKRLFQDAVLHDALECRSPAQPRMLQLVEAMLTTVAEARSRAEPPTFAPRILSDEYLGHQPPEKAHDLAALFPDCDAFRESDLARLRGMVAQLRHLSRREPEIVAEAKRWRDEARLWRRRYAALAGVPPLRQLLWLRERWVASRRLAAD
jgi:hypothetical protein